jgi:hypothetical protein
MGSRPIMCEVAIADERWSYVRDRTIWLQATPSFAVRRSLERSAKMGQNRPRSMKVTVRMRAAHLAADVRFGCVSLIRMAHLRSRLCRKRSAPEVRRFSSADGR